MERVGIYCRAKAAGCKGFSEVVSVLHGILSEVDFDSLQFLNS